MGRFNAQGAICLLLILFVTGCVSKPEPMQKVLFPPPPDDPRYEWLATIGNPSDLTSTKGGRFTELLVGKDMTPAFTGPMGVAATSDGRILVSNLYEKNIKSFSLDREQIGWFTSIRFEGNLGIAVDAEDRVFLADGKVKKVLVFSGAGEPLFSFGGPEIFSKPAFLAVNDRLGRLYVSDAIDGSIKVFSLDGEFLFSFGQKGNAEGELYGPQGLAIDSEDQVYVADMLNARISVFNSEGEFVDTFGERGQFPHQFENPKGLAIDSDDNLYIADSRRPNFRVFKTDGSLLLQIGSGQRSNHRLGFSMPVSIYVDSNDRVIVGDFFLGRVTVWQYLSEKYKARQDAQGGQGAKGS